VNLSVSQWTLDYPELIY